MGLLTFLRSSRQSRTDAGAVARERARHEAQLSRITSEVHRRLNESPYYKIGTDEARDVFDQIMRDSA